MQLALTLVPGALTRHVDAAAAARRGIVLRTARSVDDSSRRMLAGESDAGEMSLATLVQARAAGAALVALPIVTGARFLEPGIGVRPGANIVKPAEFAGRRVGIPQYWMTSSVWHRAILEGIYGVPPMAIDWVTVQPERIEGRQLPGNISVAPRFGSDLAELLRAGDIDAVLYPRPISDFFDGSIAVPLFTDGVEVQKAFFTELGFVPIMHLVVARANVLESRPQLASDIAVLLQDAKAAIVAQGGPESADLPLHGAGLAENRSLLGADLWPFSLSAYRRAVTWFLENAVRQGLISNIPSIESLFVDDAVCRAA